VTATTVNQEVKFLRGVFECARREAVIIESPLASLGRIRHHVPAEMRPFTMDEVRKLLPLADDEWRSMILFGLYTGQRLGDIARMDWGAVDLQRGELAFRMQKTGKRMLVPLAIPLLTQLASVSALDRLGPIHPRAAAKLARLGKTSCLSLEFHRLLVRAEILPPRTHKASNDSGSSRHRRAEVSFHSFRHTATSMLRDAGAPVGVAMELIGHCSPAVHRHYAHLGSDTLRRAVSLLPSL
jgi:integrase